MAIQLLGVFNGRTFSAGRLGLNTSLFYVTKVQFREYRKFPDNHLPARYYSHSFFSEEFDVVTIQW